MKRLLEPNEKPEPGDEYLCHKMGKWEWVTMTKIDTYFSMPSDNPIIRREVPDPKWKSEHDCILNCWVSDGKEVLSEEGNLKLIGEPSLKRIRATHWMPQIEGFPMPSVPVPEIPDDEIAFQKWFKSNMMEGEWIARPAWKAALEHAKQVRLEFGMKYIGQAIIDSGKK